MKIENELLVNKYGQSLSSLQQIRENFELLDLLQKKIFLTDMVYFILQSKPLEDDIQPAILESKLKPTFTPCVLLSKGVTNHHLQKIINLPESELNKALVLLLSLFKISYQRRFKEEKNNPDKWWYWDLSDKHKVEMILERVK